MLDKIPQSIFYLICDKLDKYDLSKLGVIYPKRTRKYIVNHMVCRNDLLDLYLYCVNKDKYNQLQKFLVNRPVIFTSSINPSCYDWDYYDNLYRLNSFF